MPKYYCDYCKSYLTHDTMSVRKSHLIGKNHIKNYCNYYEMKAKELGIWDKELDDDKKTRVTLTDLNRNVPPIEEISHNKYNNKDLNDSEFMLPPPNRLNGLPFPPKSIYCNTKEFQKAIYRNLASRGE